MCHKPELPETRVQLPKTLKATPLAGETSHLFQSQVLIASSAEAVDRSINSERAGMHRPEVNRCFVRPDASSRPPLQKLCIWFLQQQQEQQQHKCSLLHKKKKKKKQTHCAPANLSDAMGAGVSNALRLHDEIIAV